MPESPRRNVARAAVVTGVLAGALACIVLYSLNKWATIAGTDVGRVWVSVLVFCVAGFLIGRAAHDEPHAQRWRRAGAGYAAALLGIAMAVVFWMLLEELVFSRFGTYPIYEEHGLFPFEIAILWVRASVPLLAGIAAGVLMPSSAGPAS